MGTSHFPFSILALALDLPVQLPPMSSFTTSIIGFVILIVGLAWLAYFLNVPGIYIGIGVVIALGIGVISATKRTRMKDPPGTS